MAMTTRLACEARTRELYSDHQGIRVIHGVCGSNWGTRWYRVVGNLGCVRVAFCGKHYQNARRWRRKWIEEYEEDLIVSVTQK